MMLDLRPYQIEAIERVRQAIREGHKHIVLQLSTGGGKTLVAAKIFKSAHEKGKKAIFICDRIELIEQASARFDAEDIPHGVIQANHDRTDRTHRVQVASICTMARRMVLPADMYCIDEVQCLHKAHIKLMTDNPGAVFLSLSATPWTKGLGKHFSKLIIVSTTQQLIDEGYLVPTHVYGPSQPDLSKVKVIAGEYDEEGLADATNKPQLVGDIVQTWLKLARGHQTFAFAVNIKHSMAIVEAFKRANVAAKHIDCYSTPDERDAVMAEFREGKIQVLSSVDLLSRGVDCTAASCAILARPTRSKMVFFQQIGRVLRIHPGKEYAILLDHSGNHERHGYVTDPTPTELDDGKKKESAAQKSEPALPKPCPKCHYLKRERKCPKCGHESVTVAKDMEYVKGELVLLKGKPKDAATGKCYTTAQKEHVYAQLLWYAQRHNYKSGWAYHKAQEITGTYPARSKQVQPVDATPEIVAKIQHLNIKRRYQKDIANV